jgi:hypothetical protein
MFTLYVFRPRGVWRWVAISVACFLFWDLLRYSTISMIGPPQHLRNSGDIPAVACEDGEVSGPYRNLPSDVVEPELYLYEIACRGTQPVVKFLLLGVGEEARTTPVFFVLETPDGEQTWAMADYAGARDDSVAFSYRSDGGDGKYTVRSAFAVVDGVRGLLVWGGREPEPLAGAVQMGMPPYLFVGIVCLAAGLQGGLLLAFLIAEVRRRVAHSSNPALQMGES